MNELFYQGINPPWRPGALSESNSEWNTLFLPLPFLGLSFLYLVIMFILGKYATSQESVVQIDSTDSIDHGDCHRKKGLLEECGGATIFTFRIARLVGCVALLAVSVYQFIAQNAWHHAGTWKDIWRTQNYPQLAMIVTYWYSSLLALFALGSGRLSRTCRAHAMSILLLVFGIYAYRDVWPLATYTLRPQDENEGPVLLYVKISILAVVSVCIPLFIPRQYTPLDPRNTTEVPNPEQTASLFSLAFTYGFLNPVFHEASHVAHLPFSHFPPLADYDRSAYLKEKAFPYIDLFQKRRKYGIYWGFLRVFAPEFTLMGISVVVLSMSYFLSPWALNRILAFLEDDDTTQFIVKPWFWVICLFMGPLVSTLTSEWYHFIGTAVMIRMEGILTQLIFEHSLRVRFKAEVSKPAKAGQTSEGDRGGSGERQSSGKKENIVGKINTLVTEDVDHILEARDFLQLVVQVPMQLGVALVFLYTILGWSALVGFASIIVLLPVPGYVANKMDELQQNKMDLTDARVQSVSEAIGALRMIKLFAWEKAVSDDINEKRDKELQSLWKNKLIDSVNTVVNSLIPTSTMILTYAIYTLVMKKQLNASIVFSSMAVFDTLRAVLRGLSRSIRELIQSKVSFDRMDKFLRETELLDTFDEKVGPVGSITDAETSTEIGFKDAHFVWSTDDARGPDTPSGRAFRLKIDGTITFKRACLNVIVGPTGAGKTSILMALLGEMHYLPATVDSWYNLPRLGGVAYSAQESWVQNQTIKENILFGSPYEEERYKKVIGQYALNRDLELFEAGDDTEVGEKGLTLSGGQKARVTLARAVYSSAEIILLDDVLAALDVHTAKWIVKECLQGDLLRGRTVILATHNTPLVAPIASLFVSVDINGVARDVGTSLSTALALDPLLDKELHEQEEELSKAEQTTDVDDSGETKGKGNGTQGKLVMAEEIAVGHVARRAFMLFFRALGGRMPFVFITLWVFGMICVWGLDTFSIWFLGYWSTQYKTHNPEDVSVPFYLSIYSGILILGLASSIITELFYTFRSQQASLAINRELVDSILHSTLRWLDQTPVARILARCTQDIAILDGPFPARVETAGTIIVCMTIKLAAPVLFTPLFIIPGILVAIVGVYIGNTYLKAQLSVKREMSNSRSPLLAHFGAAISGLTSIRAYGAQEAFTQETLSRIDNYTRCARTSNNLNRWLSVRMDMLGSVLTTTLATYLLVRLPISAADIGFSLTQALEFCTMIMVIVRVYNGLEVSANNLERIQSYLDIEHEPKPTGHQKPPAAWPTSGKLHVENLSARYSADGPKVLHDLSFKIESGQRVAIVGRTGSGKTSLTLALLRCIPIEGCVYYDGIRTDKINLDALRSSITIIPQIPELLSGTLRRNLDPFGTYSDATLNEALRDAGLFSLQSNMDEGRLTLDSEISSGGGNLSVGQRQIIALARAIVRNSKLLILDEATSAVDHDTDAMIQSTLRSRLTADTSVLTIAHRLQTVMDYDKIIVLDEGKIIEFDSPTNLLQKTKSVFKAMVDGSKDRRSLYSMVDGSSLH